MTLDEASAQLHSELRKDIQTTLATRRPLLHHLNADTSWLLQIPRPEIAFRNGGRFYYNILIDPWLAGGQSDVASWFSQQFHANASAVPNIAALEELTREMEILAADGRATADGHGDDFMSGTLIDAVAISHEFTDHCHKDTLLDIHPDVPVFGIKEATRLISSWKHFRTVVTIDSFGANGSTDWRSTSLSPLPEWIGISRLLQKVDVLNHHAALLVAFNNIGPSTRTTLASVGTLPLRSVRTARHASLEPNEEEEGAEAIVYTPHGIHSGDLNLIPQASPPIRTLAFLHGLHNVRVGTVAGRTALQSNLGAHNGLKAQRILHAKYWIGTHDEVKTGGGLVSWFLQRDVITLQDALEQERMAERHQRDEAVVEAFRGTNWMDVGNGESRVLV